MGLQGVSVIEKPCISNVFLDFYERPKFPFHFPFSCPFDSPLLGFIISLASYATHVHARQVEGTSGDLGRFSGKIPWRPLRPFLHQSRRLRLCQQKQMEGCLTCAGDCGVGSSRTRGSADAAALGTSYFLRFGVQDVGSFFKEGFRVWAVVHAL